MKITNISNVWALELGIPVWFVLGLELKGFLEFEVMPLSPYCDEVTLTLVCVSLFAGKMPGICDYQCSILSVTTLKQIFRKWMWYRSYPAEGKSVWGTYNFGVKVRADWVTQQLRKILQDWGTQRNQILACWGVIPVFQFHLLVHIRRQKMENLFYTLTGMTTVYTVELNSSTTRVIYFI